VENEAYEEELKRYEDKERADLDQARLKAQQAVRHECDVEYSMNTTRTSLCRPLLSRQNVLV